MATINQPLTGTIRVSGGSVTSGVGTNTPATGQLCVKVLSADVTDALFNITVSQPVLELDGTTAITPIAGLNATVWPPTTATEEEPNGGIIIRGTPGSITVTGATDIFEQEATTYTATTTEPTGATVTWSVVSGGGSITAGGVYTSADVTDGATQAVVIRGAMTDNLGVTRTADYSITVHGNPTVSLSGIASPINVGNTDAFTVTRSTDTTSNVTSSNVAIATIANPTTLTPSFTGVAGGSITITATASRTINGVTRTATATANVVVNVPVVSITTHSQQIKASDYITSGGTLQINSGIYVWSDNTSVAALIVDVANATIINNGYIIGRGGNGGGGAGGPALNITAAGVTITNNSGAYIAGGGGGGGGGYGGGGAGGGQGGAGGAGGAIGQPGSPNSAFAGTYYSGQYPQGRGGAAGGGGGLYDNNGSDTGGAGGGGGGRVMPPPSAGVARQYAAGGGGYGGGQGGIGVGWFNGLTHYGGQGGSYGNAGSISYADYGGGGGWGAAGGAGGAGGAAITGTGRTLNNSGTIYGST